MKLSRRPSNLFILGLCSLWLGLAGRQHAQAPALSVAPANPTIHVGQTQQFTASGAVTPTNVSAGGEYTCVRLPDGTARCTGRNQFGQLGDGTFTNSPVLVSVSGLTTAARAAAGDEFNCALLADGTAKCWALGEKGQRGDGTFDMFTGVPGAVSGLTNAVSLAGGYNHACALVSDGSMRCWGDNAYGQLGNPSVATGSSVPVTVSGINSATAFITGAFHTCAVMADRTLSCWGQNEQGQVGDGTRTNASAPVTVAGLTGVAAVGGGGVHTCAALTNGTVWCWGENEFGQLGDGTNFSATTPVQVSGITGAVAVSLGWRHSCALLSNGTVQCWGQNEFGQAGDGTTTNRNTPVQVSGITGAVGITAGWWHHSCALLGNGTVKCWGVNEWGQFGNGTTTGSTTPVAMSGTGVTWTSSNAAVATIDAGGRATGVGQGTATITATDSTGATASTTLTVLDRLVLAVTRAGAGSGTVTSSPAGINCGTDCSETYDSSSTVTLTATPATGSAFAGWSGCDATSGATCTVTMNTARTVTAIFDLQRFVLTVEKAGLGAALGTVSSSPSGINCGADCYEPYNFDTLVTLTASPSLLLTGWTGCDAVSGATCTVRMRSARSVSANFLGLP
jgi:alpha-tubulin suppressor-like RCC1 family protein